MAQGKSPRNPMSWKAQVEFRGRWPIHHKEAIITPFPVPQENNRRRGVLFTRAFSFGPHPETDLPEVQATSSVLVVQKWIKALEL